MPLYNSPAIPTQLLQKGVPAYFFGGLNMLRGDAKGTVSTTALATGTGTIGVQLNEGATPVVGDLITMWGTALQSGLFNVTRALITAVNITPATGAGTISYALTGSTQSATADPGSWLMEIGETSEAIVNNSFSVPVCVQAPQCDSQFTAIISVAFPTLPTAATVAVQVAINSKTPDWTSLGTVAIVAASAQTVGPVSQLTLQRGYLYRLAVTGLSGTGTIVAKIG
jgi:hypothetical protein